MAGCCSALALQCLRNKFTASDLQEHFNAWGIEHVGFSGDSASKKVFDRGQDYANVRRTEDNNLQFVGEWRAADDMTPPFPARYMCGRASGTTKRNRLPVRGIPA